MLLILSKSLILYMNLANDIKKYITVSLPHLKQGECHFKKMSLEEAVSKSASAINVYGKIDNHQRRIGKNLLNLGASMMITNIEKLKKCKTFKEIFEISEEVKNSVLGLGDLWSYDTALRIGFNKNLYPKDVYVQAGVKKGVEKLFYPKIKKGRCLPMSIFPSEFHILKPHEIENFLCIWGKARNKTGC